MTMSIPFYKDSACQVYEIGLLKSDSDQSETFQPINLDNQLLKKYHKINRFSDKFYQNYKETNQIALKILSCPDQRILQELDVQEQEKQLSKYAQNIQKFTSDSSQSSQSSCKFTQNQKNLQDLSKQSSVSQNKNQVFKQVEQYLTKQETDEIIQQIDNNTEIFNLFSFQTPQKKVKKEESISKQSSNQSEQQNNNVINLFTPNIIQENDCKEEKIEISTYSQPDISSRMASKRKFFDVLNKVKQQLNKNSEN